MFSNDRALSLRSRLLLLAIPFCLLWASFNDRHFKNVASWFGGQFQNIIWIFCVRGLMVAFPSCKNRLWMVNSFRRKVFPNGDWLLTMSRNSSRPKTTVILSKVRRFVTTPLELRFSTVKQHSNSLASVTNNSIFYRPNFGLFRWFGPPDNSPNLTWISLDWFICAVNCGSLHTPVLLSWAFPNIAFPCNVL